MPSSARALASGPQSTARPETSFPASSSASSFATASSPQTSASSSGGASERFEAASECRPATTGASSSSWIRFAIDVASGVGLHSAGAEGELGADREDGRRADRLPQVARRVDRRLRLDREQDEVGSAHGVVVRSALGADRLGSLARALGVARADHDVDSRVDEALGDRLPEAAGPAHDCDPHAAAPSTVSASRRDASRSVISVCVTMRRTASGPAGSDSSTTSASIRPA